MCETFWEISRKTDVAKFRIHKKLHYRYLSGSAQGGKDVLKLRKFKKFFCHTAPFSPTLQISSPEFPTSTKTETKKTVPCDCLKIVGNQPGKGLQLNQPRRRADVFIVNFEHISHLVLVYLLLTLSMQLPAGKSFY